MDKIFKERQRKLFNSIAEQIKSEPEYAMLQEAIKSVKKKYGEWCYLKVSDGGDRYFVSPLSEVSLNSIFLEAEEGTSYTFTVIDMTDEEYDALPEFEGF